MKDTLPRRPSLLIKRALRDLESCEADGKYVINMHRWHEPRGGVCVVCFAGSVLAKSLNAPQDCCLSPTIIDNKGVSDKLMALNYFREGQIGFGIRELGFEIPAGLNTWMFVIPYVTNGEMFKNTMLKMATKLEKVGL